MLILFVPTRLKNKNFAKEGKMKKDTPMLHFNVTFQCLCYQKARNVARVCKKSGKVGFSGLRFFKTKAGIRKDHPIFADCRGHCSII